MTSLLTVILNWRTPDMTLRAAETALLALQGIAGALVIVDNASGDGSFEQMRDAVAARGWDQGPQRVRVLQSGQNGGFGAGNNHGILAGLPMDFPGGQRPDFVYLLNSDAFPEPDAIRLLLEHLLAHPASGLAGGFIKGEDGVPHHSAFRFPSVLSEFEANIRFGPVSRLLKNHIITMDDLPDTTAVDWLAGASLMMRMDMLERIGLFDERFFLYFEETELCRRAALAGWAADYVPQSRVTHIGSVSTGMKTWQRIPGFWLDSRHYYFRKNHGAFGLWAATLALALGGSLWRLRLLVQKKPPQDPAYFLSDLLRHHLRKSWASDAATCPARTPRPSAKGAQS